MEYRVLGRTGVNVSPLCFGTDNFADPSPEDECVKMLDMALDAGINMLDTGDVYADGEGEKIIGRYLKKTNRRHKVLIGTKVDHGQRRPGFTLDDHEVLTEVNTTGHSRLNLIRAVEGSLKRLQTDYIDLYQLHRHSIDMPMDEILSTLDSLVQSGKIRYVGCSTHPAWAVMEAIMFAELKGYPRFASEQPPYNLLDRRIENELIPICQLYGVGLITWAPMGMGVLAGRYTDANKFPKESRASLRGGFYADRVTERGIEVGIEFAKLAKRIGITSAQLSILWCKDQPGVTAPLIGPRTAEQLVSLLPILNMKLDDETRKKCDELVPPGSAVANFHNTAGWMKGKII